MNHPISPEQWVDFVDGSLRGDKVAEFESHLLECNSCMDLFCCLTQGEKVLRLETAAFRRNAAIFGELLDETIHHRTTWPGALAHRLNALVVLLNPMCGTDTATQVMRVAAQLASAGSSPGPVDDARWSAFLFAVTSQILVLCGRSAASMVWETGQSL